MSALITSVAWTPRGTSLAQPKKYALTEAELQRVSQLASVQLDEAKMELEAAQQLEAHEQQQGDGEESGSDGDAAAGWEDVDEEEDSGSDVDMDESAEVSQAKAMAKTLKKEQQQQQKAKKATATANRDPDDLAEYNLDDYDVEESKGSAMGAFSNIRGLQFHPNNQEDPYITMKDAPDSDDEQEDLEIRPTDNLLVAAKTQDEVSQLDVYVYDAAEANLYVHHDFLLPAMPLCLEWLDFHPPSATASLESQSNSSRPEKGSYIAVGTLDPDIEIWSLDVVDGLYPDAILGAPKGAGDAHQTPLEATITSLSISDAPSLAAATRGGNNKKKKKPKKSKSQPLPPAANASYHTDSILSLSWNKSHRSLLASSSADKTVKLWDLSRPSASPALRSYDFHTDKVQAVQWNQASPTTLLSGAMDGTLKVFDSRAPDAQTTVQLASDIECVKWSQWNGGAEFLVSTESGTVESYDSRTMARLWTLAAHDKAVTSMDYSDVLNGFLVTGSADHTVKLWQVAPGNISCLTSRDLGLGNVFSSNFCPDDPTALAVAGSKGKLQIWDTASNAGVRKAFGEQLKALGKQPNTTLAGDGIVGLADLSEGESDAED